MVIILINKLQIRIYYEDTDAGGVVYYANYLKYAERARTELLRSLGIGQSELAQNHNLLFIVRHVELDLIAPARLDDLIEIETIITNISGASIIMEQIIWRNRNKLSSVKVKIACVDTNFKPVRIPQHIRMLLTGVVI